MAKTYEIKEEVLVGLRDSGVQSELLEARLQFAKSNQLLTHYIERMIGVERVYPHMLPTQASGRWSTSDPPLPNFTGRPGRFGPKGIRDVVCPDLDEKWVSFDWEAIEAKFAAAYSKDQPDLEAFRKGWDIHTVTAIAMYHWPSPPFEPTKKNIFKSDPGLKWCDQIGELIGKGYPYNGDARERTLAKNCRYALLYGRDEKAMDRYAVEMKMETDELRQHGKLYLASKPWLVACKKKWWKFCFDHHMARTFLGRRRILLGDREDVEKEGWNHMIQGGVADIMNITLLTIILDVFPGLARLVYQSHDGAKIAFPRNFDPFPVIKEIVEKTWVIEGEPILLRADFETILAPDAKETV